MSTTHHPSDETLAAFMDGSLDEARRVVIAVHMELCASCRRLTQAIDALGGAHLDRLPATALETGALEKTLAKLDARSPTESPAPAAKTDDLPMQLRALAPYQLGPWRWIGPGVHWRSVALPGEGSGSRLFLLKAAPGTHLPHHAHEGTELTVILKGAFKHSGTRFGVGDCDDADETVEHLPVVGDEEECICLVAMQGRIRMLSLLGRLIQPLVRM
jgi:putative transcriptional regulator